MFLNVDQLDKRLDKKEFQEIGSMVAFKVLETQFQTFIKSWIYLDDEYVIMTHKYVLEYTQLEIPEFHDTLIQHMESVKKSIDKRALHKREYDIRMNERQIQTTEEKVDTSKALDASLVNTESSRTKSGKHDTSSSLGNDVDADDAYIKPVYDEEPMDEVQLTAECNVSAIGQQQTEQPEFNNEGEVDQNAKQCHDKRTPFNLKKERIKKWTKDNVISWRPRLHGIASLQEISARPPSQWIRSLASKTTKEKVKSLAFKAKITRKQTSDDSDCQGESDEDCTKPKENKAFVKKAWSDSEDGDETLNDATCIMAIDSQEVQTKPYTFNNDSNMVDLQKENEELLSDDGNPSRAIIKQALR
ncbi:hypothetical protein Tco_0951622 [Tanacetum coccineum]|uniref:Uncharacterized protein n=1 Tax=Tanacetum coccineum TaxID=301880 RepID=A0ABQ5DVD4_9ASTR